MDAHLMLWDVRLKFLDDYLLPSQVHIPGHMFPRLQSRLNGQFMLQGGSQEERWDEEEEEED